jgi:hypothetical protein
MLAAAERLIRSRGTEVSLADRHLYLFVTGGASDRSHQSLHLAERTARQFAQGIAAYRTAHGVDPAVSTVWAHLLVGALHQGTLWWLREQTMEIDQVTDQITALLWSGIGVESGMPRE